MPTLRRSILLLSSISSISSIAACGRPPVAPRVASPVCAFLEQYSEDPDPDPEDQANDRRPFSAPPSREDAEAIRLYRLADWKGAAAAFAHVAAGETDDALGNRQLAEYYGGLALARAGKRVEAEALFAKIANKTSHARFLSLGSWRESCR
jgi:hypothetical protein